LGSPTYDFDGGQRNLEVYIRDVLKNEAKEACCIWKKLDFLVGYQCRVELALNGFY